MSNYTDDDYTVMTVLESIDTAIVLEKSVLCPYCKGSGLDRHLDSDCMTCWGEGSILVE